MKTGEQIKSIRERLQMTQVQLSKAMRCTQAAISKYENGIELPSLRAAKVLIKVAKKRSVNLSLEDIFPD
jgi:transcriptional regulator with XRE-family HTH domain